MPPPVTLTDAPQEITPEASMLGMKSTTPSANCRAMTSDVKVAKTERVSDTVQYGTRTMLRPRPAMRELMRGRRVGQL